MIGRDDLAGLHRAEGGVFGEKGFLKQYLLFFL
jgi:hypothetical protein